MLIIFVITVMFIINVVIINVFHKLLELVIKHQFFNNKMVSILHNITISIYVNQ